MEHRCRCGGGPWAARPAGRDRGPASAL